MKKHIKRNNITAAHVSNQCRMGACGTVHRRALPTATAVEPSIRDGS